MLSLKRSAPQVEHSSSIALHLLSLTFPTSQLLSFRLPHSNFRLQDIPFSHFRIQIPLNFTPSVCFLTSVLRCLSSVLYSIPFTPCYAFPQAQRSSSGTLLKRSAPQVKRSSSEALLKRSAPQVKRSSSETLRKRSPFGQQNSGCPRLHHFIALIFDFFFKGQNSPATGRTFAQFFDRLLDVYRIADV
jgi:hypothetical protein